MIRLSAFADEASAELRGQIAAMQRNGISLLEIRGVDGENISKLSTQKVKEVRRMLDDAGISVWSMGSPIGKIGLSDDFEPHLEDFRRIVDHAQELGATKIRMFSFHTKGETDLASIPERVIERLDRFCRLTPEGIVLCHENEKKIFGETPEACLRIHEALPTVRAVFDPANFVQCDVDTLHAWKLLAPYVEYVHIKDAGADHVVVPAGMGLGNISTILKDYFARGGEVMTLEPHLTAFTGLDKLENGESLKQGMTVYRDNDEAFDAAVSALRGVLNEIGAKEGARV